MYTLLDRIPVANMHPQIFTQSIQAIQLADWGFYNTAVSDGIHCFILHSQQPSQLFDIELG
jgi:hypothetical protein